LFNQEQREGQVKEKESDLGEESDQEFESHSDCDKLPHGDANININATQARATTLKL
jgi:hypothetical protein